MILGPFPRLSLGVNTRIGVGVYRNQNYHKIVICAYVCISLTSLSMTSLSCVVVLPTTSGHSCCNISSESAMIVSLYTHTGTVLTAE